MRKFIFKSVLFVVILVAIDLSLGFAFKTLQRNAKGGDFGRNEFIHNKMTDEVLLFGSSRCIHHYDPEIITDSTGMSCYNCGCDGNGIIMFYPRYLMITERYVPKVIVYEVTPSFDLLKGDNTKYLSWMRMYYDRCGVDSVFWAVDPTERIKMLSNMYRYNSRFIQLISDNIHPLQSDVRGYRPVDKRMDYEFEVDNSHQVVYEYDPLKLHYMELLASDCKRRGINLMMAISPQYKRTNDEVFRPISDLCAKYGLPLLNHYCDSSIVFNRDYFYDSMHMNRKGATTYTNSVVKDIKSNLQ